MEAGKGNAQFLQLLDIVELDSELRPLLLEQEILLRELATMDGLKKE